MAFKRFILLLRVLRGEMSPLHNSVPLQDKRHKLFLSPVRCTHSSYQESQGILVFILRVSVSPPHLAYQNTITDKSLRLGERLISWVFL
jgi:hypothetical protein